MKKIIGGRVCDTETAKRLGTWENVSNRNDINYYSEGLYLTKSGLYFLHCEGSGNSRYGVWSGNTGAWGEKI